jgi:hypothetical protein
MNTDMGLIFFDMNIGEYFGDGPQRDTSREKYEKNKAKHSPNTKRKRLNKLAKKAKRKNRR